LEEFRIISEISARVVSILGKTSTVYCTSQLFLSVARKGHVQKKLKGDFDRRFILLTDVSLD
jgi:hypothetical protein